MRRDQTRHQDPSYSLGDRPRSGFREVSQRDDGQPEFGVAIDRGLEALPGPGMTDPGMSPLRREVPTKSVGIKSPAVQADRRPGRLDDAGIGYATLIQ